VKANALVMQTFAWEAGQPQESTVPGGTPPDSPALRLSKPSERAATVQPSRSLDVVDGAVERIPLPTDDLCMELPSEDHEAAALADLHGGSVAEPTDLNSQEETAGSKELDPLPGPSPVSQAREDVARLHARVRWLEEQVQLKDRQVQDAVNLGRGSVSALESLRQGDVQHTSDIESLKQQLSELEEKKTAAAQSTDALTAELAALEARQLSGLRSLLSTKEQIKVVTASISKRKALDSSASPFRPVKLQKLLSSIRRESLTDNIESIKSLTVQAQVSNRLNGGTDGSIGNLGNAVEMAQGTLLLRQDHVQEAMALLQEAKFVAHSQSETLEALTQSLKDRCR